MHCTVCHMTDTGAAYICTTVTLATFQTDQTELLVVHACTVVVSHIAVYQTSLQLYTKQPPWEPDLGKMQSTQYN